MVEPETDEERAVRLMGITFDMAVRVHVEDPTVVAREMRGLDRDDLRHGWLLAAACIPVDRPVREVMPDAAELLVA